jgi:hypothetical protein
MTRDASLNKFLKNRSDVESALLYAGYPTTSLQEFQSIREDLGDDFGFITGQFVDAKMMDDVYRLGTLALFLTAMLRTGVRPKLKDEFERHLRPLGLVWDKAADEIRPLGTHPEMESVVGARLEEMLGKFDISFTTKLRGAWTAYYSENPDRYRHVMSSCRELLNDVTRRVGGKGKRGQRIRKILGSKSRAEVVEDAARLVNSLYGLQSAQEHTEPDEATALFALVETEHILYFLLSHHEKIRPSEGGSRF